MIVMIFVAALFFVPVKASTQTAQAMRLGADLKQVYKPFRVSNWTEYMV